MEHAETSRGRRRADPDDRDGRTRDGLGVDGPTGFERPGFIAILELPASSASGATTTIAPTTLDPVAAEEAVVAEAAAPHGWR